MSELFGFLRKLSQFGLERFGVYYGTYRGTVTSVEDPEDRGRIKVRVRAISKGVLDVWVLPRMNGAGKDRGTFWVPEVGDSVGIRFRYGNQDAPDIYSGGWYGEDDLPEEFKYSNKKPQRRGFVTRGGHSLIFCDEPGNEFVRLTWHKADGDLEEGESADRTAGDSSYINISKDGSVVIANSGGSLFNMDSTNEGIFLIDQNGNNIHLTKKGINIISKGGGFISIDDTGAISAISPKSISLMAPTLSFNGGGLFLGQGASAISAVLGEPLMQWLATHTHGTGVGPSTTPIVPPTPVLLSKKVKLI